jgi:hypothetical protein
MREVELDPISHQHGKFATESKRTQPSIVRLLPVKSKFALAGYVILAGEPPK